MRANDVCPCVAPAGVVEPLRGHRCSAETDELPRGEDALVRAKWVRPLVALEPVEGMGGDVTATERIREDTTERGEDPLDRPGRETLRLQLARDCDDIVGGDQRQPAPPESGQQMAMELRAVEIECAIAPLSPAAALASKLGEPATCDLGECEPWRERQVAESARFLQQFALPNCLEGVSPLRPCETALDRRPSRRPRTFRLAAGRSHARRARVCCHRCLAGWLLRCWTRCGENEPRARAGAATRAETAA